MPEQAETIAVCIYLEKPFCHGSNSLFLRLKLL